MSDAPNVVLARMVLSGQSLDQIAGHLAGTANREMLALLNDRRDALGRLAQAARHVDHVTVGPEAISLLRDGFDAAARIAPDASVAAYTLGDSGLMQAATRELVAWLAAHSLLGPDRDVLDLGCGVGRVAAAIAPYVRSVLGVDVSGEMIAEAQRRHPSLRFAVVDGRGLCDAAAFDLVLAVDSFPYLVQAAVAERHVADAAALLRPGGALAILNLSYGSPEQDRDDAKRWAATYGFRLISDGDQPFRLWDGRTFLFVKPAD